MKSIEQAHQDLTQAIKSFEDEWTTAVGIVHETLRKIQQETTQDLLLAVKGRGERS